MTHADARRVSYAINEDEIRVTAGRTDAAGARRLGHAADAWCRTSSPASPRASPRCSRSPASAIAPQAQGKNLRLQLGYSHDVNFPVPEGIDVKTPDQNTVEISGIDRQQVGQVAAEIRRWRKPEPYKGKGIKYRGEYIFRKEGKKK